MPRTVPAVLVAVALLFAATASVSALHTPDPNYPGDEAAILTLGEPTTADFTNQSVDVATSIGVERDAAAARLDRYALDEAFGAVSDDGARRALLFEAITNVEIGASSLQAEERALRNRYVNGSIGTEAYVRGLVRIDARAAELRADIDRIDARSNEVRRLSLRTRLDPLETSLIALEGPVRDRAAGSLRGDAPPARLYVDASTNGVVLATIADGEYVREAYRADRRELDAVPAFGLDEAVSRAAELYPIAYNDSLRTSVGFLRNSLYLIDVELRSGSINAYLDANTRDIFYEIQRHQLDLLAPKPGVSTVGNGTRLVVNRTYRGGPLRIATYDNETGLPVSTPVVVAGERFATGDDGVRWTIVPPEPRFTVTAVRPAGNASVSVTPVEPRAVNG